MNGQKNSDKKMKWLVEAVGIFVLSGVFLEQERETRKMQFSSIELQFPEGERSWLIQKQR